MIKKYQNQTIEKIPNIKQKKILSKCLHEECNKRPTFNLPTETKGLYCSEHKLENMIDVIHKRCAHEGCNKRPNFNLPTEIRGLYCFKHKLENMVCVIVKRCVHEGCTKTS